LPEIHERAFLTGPSPIGWKCGGTAAGREYPIGCLAWGSLPAADISWYRKPHTHQVGVFNIYVIIHNIIFFYFQHKKFRKNKMDSDMILLGR
jgi:hypothetical protein